MTILEILTSFTVADMRRPEEPDGLHWRYEWRDGFRIFTFTDDVDVVRLRREAEFVNAYMRPWLTSEQVRGTVQWARLPDGRREGSWPSDPSCIRVDPNDTRFDLVREYVAARTAADQVLMKRLLEGARC